MESEKTGSSGTTLNTDLELGTRNLRPQDQEPGTQNPEPGTRNPEPGTTNPEPGTRNQEPGTTDQGPERNALTWSVRLWSNDPGKLYGVLFVCSLAALIGWICFKQIAFSLLGFIAIACATAEYWLPQRYKLDERGASVRYGLNLTAIAWSDVKRILPDDKGVKLSPLARDGKLAPFRGVYLRFAENREEVIQWIEARCGKNV